MTRPIDGDGDSDPAYAGQASYPPVPGAPAPTQQFPTYVQDQYGYQPYPTSDYAPGYPPGPPPAEPPPEGPPSRRWLWVLAALSVLTVIGLVIAVVIVNSSSQQTVVAPPSDLEPDVATPSAQPTPTTTTRRPRTSSPRPTSPAPVPPGSTPSGTVTPGATETVVYDVQGTGRAISITYVDTGGILQTEFNVMLPWTKEVELQQPASSAASVNIINFGRDVTCSITIAGTETSNRTATGLTVCGLLG